MELEDRMVIISQVIKEKITIIMDFWILMAISKLKCLKEIN
jgi:hypothetical protein